MDFNNQTISTEPLIADLKSDQDIECKSIFPTAPSFNDNNLSPSAPSYNAESYSSGDSTTLDIQEPCYTDPPAPSRHDPAPTFCRMCQSADNQQDLIVPCQCAHPTAWVHRHCLDEWRAVNVYQPAFNQCQQCNFTYVIDADLVKAFVRDESTHRWKAVGKVFLMVMSFAGAIFLMTLFIGVVDFESGSPIERTWPKTATHEVWYWLLALAITFSIIGFVGLIGYACGVTTGHLDGFFCCVWFCPNSQPEPNVNRRSNPCDCGNCNGGGGSCQGGEGCIVVVVVLAIIGVLFVVFLGAHIAKRILTSSFKREWYRVETDRNPVKDWSSDREAWVRMARSPAMV